MLQAEARLQRRALVKDTKIFLMLLIARLGTTVIKSISRLPSESAQSSNTSSWPRNNGREYMYQIFAWGSDGIVNYKLLKSYWNLCNWPRCEYHSKNLHINPTMCFHYYYLFLLCLVLIVEDWWGKLEL